MADHGLEEDWERMAVRSEVARVGRVEQRSWGGGWSGERETSDERSCEVTAILQAPIYDGGSADVTPLLLPLKSLPSPAISPVPPSAPPPVRPSCLALLYRVSRVHTAYSTNSFTTSRLSNMAAGAAVPGLFLTFAAMVLLIFVRVL